MRFVAEIRLALLLVFCLCALALCVMVAVQPDRNLCLKIRVVRITDMGAITECVEWRSK